MMGIAFGYSAQAALTTNMVGDASFDDNPVDAGLGYSYWNGAPNNVTSTATLTTSTWHHIAATYTIGTGVTQLYIDGVADFSASRVGTPLYSGSIPLSILKSSNQSATGRLADLRITNGNVRYTGAFTPPTTRAKTS